jgi:hypothetical protein
MQNLERINGIPRKNFEKEEYYQGKPIYISPSGKTVCQFSPEGQIIVNMPYLKSLGIMDISDLKSHAVFHRGDDTLHEITFCDDSFIDIIFDSAGNIKKSKSKNVSLLIQGDGEIVVHLHRGAPDAP